jgi:hypothetical protein
MDERGPRVSLEIGDAFTDWTADDDSAYGKPTLIPGSAIEPGPSIKAGSGVGLPPMLPLGANGRHDAQIALSLIIQDDPVTAYTPIERPDAGGITPTIMKAFDDPEAVRGLPMSTIIELVYGGLGPHITKGPSFDAAAHSRGDAVVDDE